jgi:predicted DNA binding protein
MWIEESESLENVLNSESVVRRNAAISRPRRESVDLTLTTRQHSVLRIAATMGRAVAEASVRMQS